MFGLARRGGGRFPMFFLLSTYPLKVRDGKQDIINQSINLKRGLSLLSRPAAFYGREAPVAKNPKKLPRTAEGPRTSNGSACLFVRVSCMQWVYYVLCMLYRMVTAIG
jgi:hypothetical protein